MWDFPLFPEQASTVARKVDLATLTVTGVALFFTALVLALIIGLSFRYRAGRRIDRTNPPESILWMEALWIGVPFVLSMGLFALGVEVYYEQYTPPGDASTIYVVGKQWMWKLQHPEGQREINELHVPVGRPIRLVMTSQDVIHSFYIPAFRVKQDVLPGRYTEMWFEPTKEGKYFLFCTEYCGTEHSRMGGTVHVMSPADYERWLEGGSASDASMAKEGEQLFVRYHCAGCHGESQVVKAPRLGGIYGRPVPILDGPGSTARFVTADDKYLRDSILLPKAQVVAGYEPLMPSYQGVIPEEDLLKIVEYIKSIGPDTPSAEVGKGAERGPEL